MVLQALRIIGGPGHAGVYPWGSATLPDGSVLIGDYENERVEHYAVDGTDLGTVVPNDGTHGSPYGVAVDPTSGDVYIGNVDFGQNVEKYDSSGHLLLRVGGPSLFTYPAYIAVAGNGTLAVADSRANKLFYFDSSGHLLRTFGTSGGGRVSTPRGIAFDAQNNLYVGDVNNRRIAEYDSQGNFVRQWAIPSGGLRGIAIDNANGWLYEVADTSGMVRRFTLSGTLLNQWGGIGSGPGKFLDGGRGVAVDGQGNVWISDLAAFRAQKFNPNGTFLAVVPNPPQPPPDGGFNQPAAVGLDSAGDVFVDDTFNWRVQKFSPAGSYMNQWGHRGSGPFGFNYSRSLAVDPRNGSVVVGQLDGTTISKYSNSGTFLWAVQACKSWGIAIGADGTIYVSDTPQGQVVVLSPSGAVLRTFGSGHLTKARGIAVDNSDGSVWLTDQGTGYIDHFSSSGAFLGRLGGPSYLRLPVGIAVDQGFLLVADQATNSLKVFSKSGAYDGASGHAGNGLGALSSPQGVALGTDGNLYVAEQGNQRVQVFGVIIALQPPSMTALTPSLGPVAGGQTVTVTGLDFGTDTRATFGGSPITISNLTPTSFTFVTPPSALAGGTHQVQATDALGTTAALTYTYVGLANYVPVTPFRLLDTRNTGGPLGPGAIRPLQVTGAAASPLPSSATAAVVNVTEVSGSASSLLAVYPYGTSRPNASNLNFAAHTVIANLVTVTLGSHSGQGWINIYNALGSVNVLVDVEGYFTPQLASDVTGLFHPISPVGVCDTRHPSPTPICSAHGALGPGASMVVNFATTGGLPGDGTAEAVVVNLTGVAGTASTYLSMFPTNSNGGCTVTGTSTINLAPGAVQANRVMVALGPSSLHGVDDALCVYNAAGIINVLIDANGWYGSSTAPASPVGYQYQALAPTRICDTRVMSTSCSAGAIGTSATRLITVAGHAGVPGVTGATTVVAIIANLTAVAPTARTYLTLYPANLLSVPTVSDLNLEAGAVLPNLAVVKLDTTMDANDGYVDLYNSAGSVNAIIDIEGWFQ